MMDNDRFAIVGDTAVSLSLLGTDGPILDLCAGGEGVIGQLMGDRVVAIDASLEELKESPPGPLKIVMDARKLQFLDGTFPSATCFFGLMYIPSEDLPAVFEEVFRVLAPGGEFHVWDCIIPSDPPAGKDVAVCRVRVRLADREIVTGYGTLWPTGRRDADCYAALARQAGFEILEVIEEDGLVRVRARKP